MDPLAEHRAQNGDGKWYAYIKQLDVTKSPPREKQKDLPVSPGKLGPITFFPDMEK